MCLYPEGASTDHRLHCVAELLSNFDDHTRRGQMGRLANGHTSTRITEGDLPRLRKLNIKSYERSVCQDANGLLIQDLWSNGRTDTRTQESQEK